MEGHQPEDRGEGSIRLVRDAESDQKKKKRNDYYNKETQIIKRERKIHQSWPIFPSFIINTRHNKNQSKSKEEERRRGREIFPSSFLKNLPAIPYMISNSFT